MLKMSSETEIMILAAGKGRRLGLKEIPKPLAPIGGRPIMDWLLETLENMPVEKQIIVVGHLRNRIIERYKEREKIEFAHQEVLGGNASAVLYGMEKVSPSVSDILVIQGDDSAFLTKETLLTLMAKHKKEKYAITLLLTRDFNPSTHIAFFTLRNDGTIAEFKKIEDVSDDDVPYFNTGTLCMEAQFARRNIPSLRPRPNGEIRIPDLIQMALDKGIQVGSVIAREGEWMSVNTSEELLLASKKAQGMKGTKGL